MKKVYLLTIFLLFVITINVIAVDFDKLANNAETKYSQGEGRLEYLLTPFIFIDGEKQEGLINDVSLDLGVGDNTEIYGNIESVDNLLGSNFNLTIMGIGLKSRVDRDDWVIATNIAYTSISNGNGSISEGSYNVGLLTDYKLSSRMVLYNNLYLNFYENLDDSTKRIINGLCYDVDTKTRILVKLYTNFVDGFSNSKNAFTAALEHKLDDIITYTGRVGKDDFDFDNTSISNQLEFKIEDGLYLTGEFLYNTDSINNLKVKVEKEFEQLSIIGKYNRQLEDNAYSDLTFGIGYDFN